MTRKSIYKELEKFISSGCRTVILNGNIESVQNILKLDSAEFSLKRIESGVYEAKPIKRTKATFDFGSRKKFGAGISSAVKEYVKKLQQNKEPITLNVLVNENKKISIKKLTDTQLIKMVADLDKKELPKNSLVRKMLINDVFKSEKFIKEVRQEYITTHLIPELLFEVTKRFKQTIKSQPKSLTPLQKRIVDTVIHNGKDITLNEIAGKIGVRESNVKEQLDILVKEPRMLHRNKQGKYSFIPG